MKEQLKKMGSFEFYQTSFSCTDVESGEERFVGVPEQGGRNLISSDPLAPGPCMREPLRPTEPSECSGSRCPFPPARESCGRPAVWPTPQRSRSTGLQLHAGEEEEIGIARELHTSDLHVEIIDLLDNRVEGEIGLSFFLAAISALKKAPSMAALLVTGDLSIQRNIKGLRSLVAALQVAMDNGARRALIPLEISGTSSK